MEKHNIRSVWADAPKAGAAVGAIVTAVLYLNFWLAGWGGVLLVAELIAVGYCIYNFSKQRGQMYGALGYTYGQSMSYILVMMLFAGFIYGVGYFFIVNYVAPGYFEEMFGQALEQARGIMGGMVTDESIEISMSLIHSPLYWIFYGILAMLVYGGIVGLFVSALVKRPPQSFNNQDYES